MSDSCILASYALLGRFDDSVLILGHLGLLLISIDPIDLSNKNYKKWATASPPISELITVVEGLRFAVPRIAPHEIFIAKNCGAVAARVDLDGALSVNKTIFVLEAFVVIADATVFELVQRHCGSSEHVVILLQLFQHTESHEMLGTLDDHEERNHGHSSAPAAVVDVADLNVVRTRGRVGDDGVAWILRYVGGDGVLRRSDVLRPRTDKELVVTEVQAHLVELFVGRVLVIELQNGLLDTLFGGCHLLAQIHHLVERGLDFEELVYIHHR